MAGLADGHDRSVVRGDLGARKFSALHYRGETLLAVDPGEFARGSPGGAQAAGTGHFAAGRSGGGCDAAARRLSNLSLPFYSASLDNFAA